VSAATPVRRLDRGRCVLLVIDIQERLAPHIEAGGAILARSVALMTAATRFGIPALATEHAADRIGALVASVRDRLAAGDVFAKRCFAATDEPDFDGWLRARNRPQVVLTGMEAHVCVMQTALGLAAAGYETFVVADAVGSRAERREDRELALDRMKDAGCTLAGTDTVLFEWTRSADDPAFRDVLPLVKSLPLS
jgi:nicotinamidase-related amidase